MTLINRRGGAARTGKGRLVSRRLQDRASQVIFILVLLALWAVIASVVDDSARVPNPLHLPADAWAMIGTGELGGDLLASLRRIGTGFALAVLVGVLSGVFMALNRRADAVLDMPVEILRPIPALALIPVLLLVVGIGDTLAICVVFYAAVFPIILNTASGLRNVERSYVEAGRVMGARRAALVREVYIPAALPSIFSGLRTGFQFAWMSIVGAELIGASNGMGYMILYYAKFVATDKVLVGMVTIGLVGLALDRVLLAVLKGLTPWAQQWKSDVS